MKTYLILQLVLFLAYETALTLISCGKDEPLSVDTRPNIDSLVYGATEKPFGLSYTGWIDKWFKEVPVNICNPSGNNGTYVILDQSGLVYFLSGSNTITNDRNIEIHPGTAILFPVVDVIKTYPCSIDTTIGPPGYSMDEYLAAKAAQAMISISSLSITLDGLPYRRVYQHRYISSSFQIFNNHMLGDCFDACIMPDQVQNAVSDGYWIMLKSIDAGEHTLHLHADMNGYGQVADITYHITVN